MDYQQRLSAGIIAITALCAQYTIILTMALPAPKAQWVEEETSIFIDYMLAHWSEGESGNFKLATYNGAAAHIAPHLVEGPAKSPQMCKTKWGTVCISLSFYRSIN
jgi:hypothetical protein